MTPDDRRLLRLLVAGVWVIAIALATWGIGGAIGALTGGKP